MECWNILQMAPTTDVRAIKKAYAVLLKKNRPDENPAGFQQLYDAYQNALCWAEDQLAAAAAPRAAEPAAEITAQAGDANDHAPAHTTAAHADAADDDNVHDSANDNDTGYGCGDPNCESCAADAAWEKHLDEQWEVLVQRVEDTLTDDSLRNDPAAWHFLVETEALLDIDFKGAFAMRFLQRLLQLFSEQRETGKPLLQPVIVSHLNQLFWWSERRHYYDDYIDPDLLDDFMLWWQPPAHGSAMASTPPEPLTPLRVEQPAPPPAPVIPYGNYYVRWLAMLIDCALLFALGALAALLSGLEAPAIVMGLMTAMLGYPLASAGFEMSPLQGTPGKIWCQLKVCDYQRRPLGPLRALSRALAFAVSFYFIYITIIVNLLIWDGRLAHDRVSGSMVLKR